LAAVELKKKNWRFHKKYRTWFRKVDDQKANPSDNNQNKVFDIFHYANN
jgi:CCR4-NOT transcriptional regulation complex NOT5 subunit